MPSPKTGSDCRYYGLFQNNFQTLCRRKTHPWPRESVILATMVSSISITLILSLIPLSTESAPSDYVGRQRCIECHSGEHRLWATSHHASAMLQPGEKLATAKFDGATVNAGGVLSRFFFENGSPQVEVTDRSGQKTLPVKYFFGIEPCQQILIEQPNGRLQSYPVAWSTGTGERKKGWYSLFPGEETPPGDPLHWTGSLNNWNHMCAECHSTGVVKNFNAQKNIFETRYEEIDVSCEACHGPGSSHVEWAVKPKEIEPDSNSEQLPIPKNKGFSFSLARDLHRWVREEGQPVARREPALPDYSEQDTCARCHSRRTALVDGSQPGTDLSMTHRLSLLDEGLYYPDGQILDEVYVHGSFLQSRMHMEGVSCSDCHDPHSGALHLEGNALCIGCHEPSRYDQPSHHHHEPKGAGSACIDCHMTSRVYMGTDRRHDHSFRVPRPDLSFSMGTPNACNSCHEDQSPEWADQHVRDWFPNGRSGQFHWGEALHAARSGKKTAPGLMRMALQDSKTAPIAKATVLAEFSTVRANSKTPSMEDLQLIAGFLSDGNPLVRRGALLGLRSDQPYDLGSGLLQLLDDPDLSVRLTATEYLAPVIASWPDTKANPRPPLLNRALSEYKTSQEIHSDRAEALLNLGRLAEYEGSLEKAALTYRKALQREPHFGPASVNLADVLARLSRMEEALLVLKTAIGKVPDDAGLHHALGLIQVRTDQKIEALGSFKKARDLAPSNQRYTYVYAIALNDGKNTKEAIKVLKEALIMWPNASIFQNALQEYQSSLSEESDS